MRRASSAWPRALLILCAPVCARSSRLRKMRAPPSLRGEPRAPRRAASDGRRSAAAARRTRRRTRDPAATREVRLGAAPRPAPPASRARTVRRTRRSSRARPDRAARRPARSSVSALPGHRHLRLVTVTARPHAQRCTTRLLVLHARRLARRPRTHRRPAGRDGVDGLGDVLGRQAAGQHHAAASRRLRAARAQSTVRPVPPRVPGRAHRRARVRAGPRLPVGQRPSPARPAP